MFAGNWFRMKQPGSRLCRTHQPLAKGKRRKESLRSRGRSLNIEALEDRCMLAIFVVQSGADAGVDTLRQAIGLANATPDSDTIVFADHLFQTSDITKPELTGISNPLFINLDSELTISNPVDIIGPSSASLTIMNSSGRVFNITTSGSVTLEGMTLTGSVRGAFDRGGAILSLARLTVEESVITSSFAQQGGGGIHVEEGSLDLVRSLMRDNRSGGGGGAIFNGKFLLGSSNLIDHDSVPTTTIVNSTITGNSTFNVPFHPGFGGGVFNLHGYVNIQNSAIIDNSASACGGGVANYGTKLIDLPHPHNVITRITHSIVYDNQPEDLCEAEFNITGAPLVLGGILILDYNIIGDPGNVIVPVGPPPPT